MIADLSAMRDWRHGDAARRMQRMTEEDWVGGGRTAVATGPHTGGDTGTRCPGSGVRSQCPAPAPSRPIPAPMSRDALLAPALDSAATAPGSCDLGPVSPVASHPGHTPCQISAENPDAGIETEPTFILLP